MKRGFTLIELLAVIVILSIVGIITIPLIGDVIEESRKKALEQSAYGLVETANYLALNNNGLEHFTFTSDGVTSATENRLDYKGKIDAIGDLYIDEEGNISLCLTNDKYYVYKSYNTDVRLGERKVGTEEEDNCRIKTVNGKYIAYLESDTSSNYVTQGELASIIGDMSTLEVNEANRGNVVSAMNEIYSSIGTNISSIQSLIGNLSDLSDDFSEDGKANVISAINENNNKINDLNTNYTNLLADVITKNQLKVSVGSTNSTSFRIALPSSGGLALAFAHYYDNLAYANTLNSTTIYLIGWSSTGADSRILIDGTLHISNLSITMDSNQYYLNVGSYSGNQNIKVELVFIK